MFRTRFALIRDGKKVVEGRPAADGRWKQHTGKNVVVTNCCEKILVRIVSAL